MSGSTGSRFLFQNNGFFHRLVGARGGGSALPSSMTAAQDQDSQQPASHWQHSGTAAGTACRPSNLGHIFHDRAAAKEIAKSSKLVFFGEIHSRPPIVHFQGMVQDAMMARIVADGKKINQANSTLHVVMEHFSFDMQPLLDEYQDDKISFEQLVERYNEIGTENHDLRPYRSLLEDAKRLNQKHNSTADGDAIHPRRRRVQLHAGFLSRTYAQQLMKEGPQVALHNAAQWLPPNPQLVGTDEHYNIFESLLTGRLLTTSSAASKPDDRFRKIFQAQVLKDVAMAHKIHTLLVTASSTDSNPEDDRILVLLGNGHCLGYRGVPERVLEQHPELAPETCVIVSQNGTADLDENDKNSSNEDTTNALRDELVGHLYNTWGLANLADYVYVYREPEEEEDDDAVLNQESQPKSSADADAVKQETMRTYNKVGESAHIPGNATKAMAIMKAMHYTDAQIAITGSDVHNFQGVGNPHIHARIRPGDVVLDVGSGLGIDTFVAQDAATSKGFVVGIDISATEVRHAQQCAQRRHGGQTPGNVRFVTADMEQIPLPDQSVDVVISNGAFCLAPNKEKAFREVYRVLKPGGRISICTTTTRDESKLEPGVSWPVCMKMFIPLNDLAPLCETIGFVNVVVDDSDSSMSMELPVEVLKDEEREDEENLDPNNSESSRRNKVHVGAAEVGHLEDYDMDAICARVCVVARKPGHTGAKNQ